MEGVRLRIKDVDLATRARSLSETARAPRIDSRCSPIDYARRSAARWRTHVDCTRPTWATDSERYGCRRARPQVSGGAARMGLAVRFPADRRSVDPRSGIVRRHHLFATHCSNRAMTSAPVHEPLRHSDVQTTMICTHVLDRGGPARSARSIVSCRASRRGINEKGATKGSISAASVSPSNPSSALHRSGIRSPASRRSSSPS